MSFRPSEHPVLKLPSPEEMAGMDAQELRRVLMAREELIAREKQDPLRYGYEPWTFKLADELLDEGGISDILAMGQNRSGKTIWAAKRMVRGLVRKPGALWAVFEASEQASVNKQQAVIFSLLPPEWRHVGKEGQVAYVKYTKQNGFSGGKFTLPNSSQCLFFNYKQDVGVFEGYELDGAWFDELVPLAFLEAMEFRLGQERRLELITTFTPVTGYTLTVGRFMNGAAVARTHRAELLPQDMVHVRGCPPGHMPLVMRCRNPQRAVVFFPWGSNPFGANEEVRDKLQGASLTKIKIRAYGWTDKQVNGAFAKFGPRHVISARQWAEMNLKSQISNLKSPKPEAEAVLTRYCAADPGGSKNWFIKWYAVNPAGHVCVYREWPDVQTHGEWAVSPGGGDRTRLFDWRPGPAQRSEAGRGISGYKRLILEAEGWVWDETARKWDGAAAEKIEARVIDPRMGGMEAPGEDEGTSIIAMMAEEQTDRDGNVTGPAMEWIPAPGSRVDETVQMINDAMDFDEAAPVNILNCPRWYVLETCQQSILAYQEFTGLGTEKDALKDIVDPDRYFIKADLGYVEAGSLASRRGGCY